MTQSDCQYMTCICLLIKQLWCIVVAANRHMTIQPVAPKWRPWKTSPTFSILRSANAGYAGHCEAVASKAGRISAAIRRAVHVKSPELLWPAFQFYVLPVLMYALSAWNLALQKDIDILERVQKRFTKCIHGMQELSYLERLRKLDALTVANRRTFADMVFIFKCLHGLVNFPPTELGLAIVTSVTRGEGTRLRQKCPNTRSCGNLFCYRAVTSWNKLPMSIITSNSVRSFKLSLHNYLSRSQCQYMQVT